MQGLRVRGELQDVEGKLALFQTLTQKEAELCFLFLCYD